MKKLKAIACLGLVLAISLPTIAEAQKQEESKPNVIFIMLDDMGWADLGSYGSKAVSTPNLDALAKSGIRFTDAYAGHTVCAPSRAVMMTGKHAGHARVRSNSKFEPLRDEDVTVSEVFKAAGYVTGGFGKWGLGSPKTSGAAHKQGFDTFFGYYNQDDAHTYYPSYLDDTGKRIELPGNAKVNKAAEKALKKAGKKPNYRGPANGPVSLLTEYGDPREFSHYLIYDRTKQFIAENKDNPFFCYAAWTLPHSFYHIPENDPAWLAYKDKPWPIGAKVHATFTSMADRHIGELIQMLEDFRILDNTLVFFMSDNGTANRYEGSLDSSGPLKGYKRSMHDGGIRSPLIVSWPGKIKGGQVSDLITFSGDFMPTAAELIGAEAAMPDDIDGLSILPTLLSKKGQKKHECLYWEWPGGQPRGKWGTFPQAVRNGKWKLTRMSLEEPWQLYNLRKDIGEENNIADSHPDVVARLDKWVKNNRTPYKIKK